MAPTVGQEMYGVTFRPGSTGGVGDTIAVGLVWYFDETGASHVLNADFWMPANEDPAGWSTVSIGGINIFVGFTAKALDDLGCGDSALRRPVGRLIKASSPRVYRRKPNRLSYRVLL